MNGVSIDGQGLRNIGPSVDHELTKFSWAKILRIFGSIEGCAGRTAGRSTVRRRPVGCIYRFFLKASLWSFLNKLCYSRHI